MGFQIDNGVLVKYTEEAGITEVVIPEGVTSIDFQAFRWCKSLTSVVIPEGVTSIGDYAFYDCKSLTSIVIPQSVTSIGDYAFYGCKSLTSIVIPQDVTYLGDYAFSDCDSLASIIIPDSVMSIGDYAFMWCENLNNIILPNGIKSLKELQHYSRRSLNTIDIPDSVSSIGRKTFWKWYNLTSIVIPQGVTSIGDSAFDDCNSLTSIVIPEGVTSIGNRAFRRCSNLTSIIIPESVTSIGYGIFEGCDNLKNVVLPSGVTNIGIGAFNRCNSLTSIVIPEGVKSIEGSAFWGCSNLTSIVIPEGVASIGNRAFYGCSSLTSLVIPEGVTNIGEQAFRECNSLTSIVIPEGVTSIGGETFVYCRSLARIVLPESISSIGGNAFTCTALREIQNIDLLIRKGCKIHSATLIWLLENLWNGPEFLSETAQVYLTNPGKAVNEICESRLFEDCAATADVMLGLIEVNLSNASALKKISTFALTCGGELPREKLIAIYEALKEIGAKPAVKLLEKAVQNEEGPKLEGATGHPIEAICQERFKEALLDRDLKAYGIAPKLFTGVHYQGTKTMAPEFVVKCAIHPYMVKLKDLPRAIGGYQTDFIEVEPDPQIDEIAKTLEREELQELLQSLIHQFDPFKWRLLLPYCRYGSGKQMNAIAAMIKKWQVWGDFDAAGRRFIIVLHGAMMLSDTREAMFLMEKWGMFDAYARTRNTTAEVLRDSVLTEFDFDSDGSKHYNLGNSIIAASINQDLTLSLFNETTGKEVKSLPKRGADEEKYAAASAEFADLKKNIKNAVKNRVARFKESFVSPVDVKASDWKSSYTKNYVLKRLASLLVWQWQHKESAFRFMLEMDGIFIDCTGRPVEVADIGSIILAHPVEIPTEELDCWKELLTQKQIAQPFVQIFEPVNKLGPSEAAKRYEGIELPVFLLSALAKEGILSQGFQYEGNWLGFQGKALTIDSSVISDVYYSERSIPFDAMVKLVKVTIEGTPRAANHEIYAMDKALIENRVRNGDIAAVQASSRVITAKTIQHLIDVSIQVEQMEVTAWLMNYKNDHFPYTFADLEL